MVQGVMAMKRTILGLLIIMTVLSGCMYPRDRLVQNQVPVGQNIQIVQQAVEQYRQNTGVLPIQTRDPKVTPHFLQYPVDFNLLKPRYLPTVPGNSFEGGGSDLYMLIDVETNPQVKLVDLHLSDTVGEVQRAVKAYYIRHKELPVREKINDGFYRIDFSHLGMPERTVVSPVTHQTLPLIMDTAGNVLVDYGSDLMQVIQNNHIQPGVDVDLRQYFIDESYYLPVYSAPYYWVNSEPKMGR
jgi:hypothetical protein